MTTRERDWSQPRVHWLDSMPAARLVREAIWMPIQWHSMEMEEDGGVSFSGKFEFWTSGMRVMVGVARNLHRPCPDLMMWSDVDLDGKHHGRAEGGRREPLRFVATTYPIPVDADVRCVERLLGRMLAEIEWLRVRTLSDAKLIGDVIPTYRSYHRHPE